MQAKMTRCLSRWWSNRSPATPLKLRFKTENLCNMFILSVDDASKSCVKRHNVSSPRIPMGVLPPCTINTPETTRHELVYWITRHARVSTRSALRQISSKSMVWNPVVPGALSKRNDRENTPGNRGWSHLLLKLYLQILTYPSHKAPLGRIKVNIS